MNKYFSRLCGLFATVLLFAMAEVVQPILLSDHKATVETQALYHNLQMLQGKQLILGHQDSLAYGFTWNNEPGRSDVKDVTGSFAGLQGWDVSQIEIGASSNLDGVSFELMKNNIKQTYLRGGVNTISWHMTNPVSGGKYNDTKTQAVRAILPGGTEHAVYKQYLDAFVAFNGQLTVVGKDGVARVIPIIFRPLHEHNGEWFWWGKGNATEQDFIQLWQFTVHYLRDVKHQHNLIIAFSPDRSRIDLKRFEKDYLYAYPGDQYVDIVGLDNYWDLGHPENKASTANQQKDFVASLEGLAKVAKIKRKIPALTEAGSESVPDATFWTNRILKNLLASEDSRQVVYAMMWRNATEGGHNKKHFYVPYKGQASAADFVKFKLSDHVLFEDELPAMYKKSIDNTKIIAH
ncbi:MAG: glycosyl hydrolase [Pseudomonadota bacterium]